jgi:PAS domain S-box-containing protein
VSGESKGGGARDDHAAALERVRRRSVAIQQSPAAVAVADATASIEYVNRRFTQITGCSPEVARGQRLPSLKSGKTSAAAYEEAWRT